MRTSDNTDHSPSPPPDLGLGRLDGTTPRVIPPGPLRHRPSANGGSAHPQSRRRAQSVEHPGEAPYWTQYVEVRTRLAEVDRQQAFFYELEKQTCVPLLRGVLSLPEAEIGRRIQAVALALARLAARLAERSRRRVPAPLDQPILSYIAALIRQPAREAFDVNVDPRTVGDALQNFAAGDLRRRFFITTGGKARLVAVGDPDSHFIFYVGEVALACVEQEVDPGFWNAMLPHGIRMQQYYLARLGPRRMPIRPVLPLLSVDERLSIDRSVPASTIPLADVQAMMTENAVRLAELLPEGTLDATARAAESPDLSAMSRGGCSG